MIELVGSVAAFGLSIVIGAVGYGRLRQSVISAKETADERHELITGEITSLKREQTTDSAAFTEIKISLAEIKMDVKNIKENFSRRNKLP